MGTWEATKPAIMSRAGTLHSLPVILDDTKHAQADPQRIAEAVFAIPSGRERERGHRDGGMRRSKEWLTTLISTGEQRITSFSNDKGTRGRVLTFFAPPFPSGGDAAAYVDTLHEHYGHAGATVAAFAAERWDELKLMHRRALKEWHFNEDGRELQPGDLAKRLLPHVATMELAAEALQVDATDALRLAQATALLADDAGDVHRQAFEDLVGWCYANSHRFWNGTKDRQDSNGRWLPNDISPSQGWAGRTLPDGDLWVLTPVFEAELTRMGHRPAECLEVWAAKGWSERKTESQRLPSGSPRGRRLRPSILERNHA